MDRITAAGGSPTGTLANGQLGFVDENLSTGQEGTLVPAAFLNEVQEELMAVLAAAELTPNVNNWTQLLQSIQLLISKAPSGFAVYNAGAFTWTPGANVTQYGALVIGGGGPGGAGAGSGAYAGFGGGAGGMAVGFATCTPGTGINGVVGAAGTGTTSGGGSSFGALAATGGGVGAAGSTSFPTNTGFGSPGVGSGGLLNLLGEYGCGPTPSTTDVKGGDGGGAPLFGGGGKGGFGPDDAGSAATSYGGGGGGGAGNAGGNGYVGLVLVWWG